MRLLVVFLFAATFVLHAHVTVRPQVSTAGANEKYTMRVPTERNIPTVRVEVEFPSNIELSSFDPKPGWEIVYKKDASGKITGATLSGSTIPPREAAEFSFESRNPREETKLVWKVIQVYEDGSRSEWTGPAGSRSPAPVTTVKASDNKQ
ncbi:MAG: DUF1775 domain-containing protein [Bryobacteraceae bacterium]|nr:DUF1775 domain-containing protein [Bryobacteraceae bacterium]